MTATAESTARQGTSALGLRLAGEVRRGAFALRAELDAAPGEVVGVIGPNGAGKTTLLRTLAGLEQLTGGVLTLDGTPLDDPATGRFVPAEQRAVGVVFQNYRLFPAMSVLENVAFGPRSRGVDRRRARETASGWLTRLGLDELGSRRPAHLSGGQAQRVALARALAVQPRLLLLDEPLAALDADTRLQVRGELRRHLAAFDGATVLVTHDPLEAMIMTDRLVVVENGRVVQSGPPAEVARRPATQYVARLVGLNLYRGEFGANGLVRLAEDAGTLVAAPDATRHGAALVALRPNAIALHTERPPHGSPRNVWPGVVDSLDLLADRVRVQVSGRPSAMVDLTADAVADLGLHEGVAVWLSAKATDVDVYADRR